MKHVISRWAMVPVIAAVVVFFDQWTKGLIEQSIPIGSGYAPIPALAPYFNLVHYTNTGAAFGILKGNSSLFVAIALVVCVAVLIYAKQLPVENWAVRACLGLQLGGAIGNNLFDRIQLGHVTDFLLFTLPVGDRVYAWPAWNVADGSIVVGVILMALLILRQDRQERAVAATAESC